MSWQSSSTFGVFLGVAAFLMLLAGMAYPIYRVHAARMKYRYGTLEKWRTWHLGFGVGFLGFMLLHAGFRLPDDFLTGAVFYVTILAGLGGGAWWLVQRFVPRKLARLNGYVLFERIPQAHEHLLAQGEELSREASTQLARFYRETWLPAMQPLKFSLAHFFSPPMDMLARPSTSAKALLRSEEHSALAELHRLYLAKLELEMSYSLQLTLKYFHLAHGPVAIVLLALVLVHALSVIIF